MAKKNIKVALTNHTFELRNVQVAEFMSEETTAFSTDVYIDGVKCGYCKNSGRGEGNYPMILPNYRSVYAEISAEVETHMYHAVYGPETYDFPYNMDFLIGSMVEVAYYDNKGTYFFQDK